MSFMHEDAVTARREREWKDAVAKSSGPMEAAARADRAEREWQEAVAKSNDFAARAQAAEAMAKCAASQGVHNQAGRQIHAPIGQLSPFPPAPPDYGRHLDYRRQLDTPGLGFMPPGASAAHRYSAAIAALEEQARKLSAQARDILAAADFLRKLP